MQILEEAIAMPHPVLTDASAMKELIPPPTFFTRMLSAASSALAPGSSNASAHNAPAILEARQTLSSPIPWRRNGIRHQNQECFFDIAEELNAIVDKCVSGSSPIASTHACLHQDTASWSQQMFGAK